jgi:hypothetical protein
MRNDLKKPKFVIIQPSHVDGRKLSKDSLWSPDSFNNLSRLFDAQLFHITHNNIDETADVYWLINFDIELLDKEIAFLKRMKEKGKKIIVGFSQDRRFLMGQGLLNSRGTLYTELCDVADVVSSGMSKDLFIFGRYENKVVHFGEIFEEVNLSIPVEQRDIDFMVSGEKNGDTLAFELELLLMINQHYPERKLACCVPNEVKIKEALKVKYPQIFFPDSSIPFIGWLKHSKYYCNMELRPRSGRCMIESYYCKVPFISSKYTYHSNLFYELAYNYYDTEQIFQGYDYMTSLPYEMLISTMEERATYDKFESVYNRIIHKLFLKK